MKISSSLKEDLSMEFRVGDKLLRHFEVTDIKRGGFGIVLYEMLTGQMPFPLPDTIQTWGFYKRHHQEVPPKPPRRINHLIPVALEQAVLKCLEKNPDDRYLSFRELREKLMELGLSIVTRLSLRLIPDT